jgi:ribosomal protein S18 acetylase RimI-like enzyme
MIGPIRPPREGDIPAVVRLTNDHSPEPVAEHSVSLHWTAPGVELAHDARIEDHAFALVKNFDEARVWIDVQGRPSATLLDWAVARAAEKGHRLLSGSWVSNEPLLRELERREFRCIRNAHRMSIDLGRPTAECVWPEGICVRTFRPGDERTFYELQRETFADSWEPIEEGYDEWAHWWLTAPRFAPELWFLALAVEEPVGLAICHPHPGDGELGWIGVLGVRRSARTRGIGRALLLHAFAEFRDRGMTRAGLGVDAESLTGANKLYEQVGMCVSARFDIYEKVMG